MDRIRRIFADEEPMPRDVAELNGLARASCDAAWRDADRWSMHYDRAIALLEAALALDPDAVVTLTNLGAALSDTGHHRRALEVLRRAEALGSEDRNLFGNIAVAMVNIGAESRALADGYFDRARILEAGEDTMAAWIDLHGH